MADLAKIITNPATIKQLLGSLSENNAAAIIITAIAAGAVCYVCNNGGNLEVSYGELKISLKNDTTVEAA